MKKENNNLNIEEKQEKTLSEIKTDLDSVITPCKSHSSYEFIKGIKLTAAQKSIVNVEKKQILINGSPGSGKSIVLLYKLIRTMAEEKQSKRFLYISYNQTLIDDTIKRAKMSAQFNDLYKKHEEVKMTTFHEFGRDMLKEMGYKDTEKVKIDLKNIEMIKGNALRRIASVAYNYRENGCRYSEVPENERLSSIHDDQFVRDEILWMKANGYIEKENYMTCERVGRGSTPLLTENQRKTIFRIFEEYTAEARALKWNDKIVDLEDYALELLDKFNEIPEEKKYDYIFVDEVQDLDAMQLKLLAMLNPKSLIIAGDNKQKIYKRSPHSLMRLGIDVENNIRDLNENFRSTEQIMNLANSLEFNDVSKDSKDIKYKNKGTKPSIYYFDNPNKALDRIGEKIKKIQEHTPEKTIAIITREEDLMVNGNSSKLKEYLGRYCLITTIDQYIKKFHCKNEKLVIYTDLYNVKGLEFDHVFLLQFDRNHYPSKVEIEKLKKYSKVNGEEKRTKDYEELINTEKKRLYVAMSRAKEHLEIYCITRTEEGISPFIEDFNKEDFIYERNIKKLK